MVQTSWSRLGRPVRATGGLGGVIKEKAKVRWPGGPTERPLGKDGGQGSDWDGQPVGQKRPAGRLGRCEGGGREGLAVGDRAGRPVGQAPQHRPWNLVVARPTDGRPVGVVWVALGDGRSGGSTVDDQLINVYPTPAVTTRAANRRGNWFVLPAGPLPLVGPVGRLDTGRWTWSSWAGSRKDQLVTDTPALILCDHPSRPAAVGPVGSPLGWGGRWDFGDRTR